MTSIFISVIVLVAVALLAWLILDLRNKLGTGEAVEKMAVMAEKLSALSEQNRELRQLLDSKLSETHKVTREHINQTIRTVEGITGQSARQIADVVAGLTRVEEVGRQMANHSAQLQDLQDILKNPKQRGVLGEYYLETVLKNVLPPGMYKMQYPFKNGEIVDAAVFVDKKIVPIDSKFSLENYNRLIHAQGEEKIALEKLFVNDLKLRIQETAKYIRPDEGTMDFAFMFIPSEGIFYDLLTNQVGGGEEENLIQRAASKYKVIIVSPTSFLAYLQTVLQGLRALQIEENAREIRSNVEKLGKHIVGYEEYLKKMGNHLSTTVNSYNNAYREFGKIDRDVARITEAEAQTEPVYLEKPLSE